MSSRSALVREDLVLVREVKSKFHRWNQFDKNQPAGLEQLRSSSNVSIIAPPVPRARRSKWAPPPASGRPFIDM